MGRYGYPNEGMSQDSYRMVNTSVLSEKSSKAVSGAMKSLQDKCKQLECHNQELVMRIETMNKELNNEREKWQQKAIAEMNHNDETIRSLKTHIDTLDAEKQRHLDANALERENWAKRLEENEMQIKQATERMTLDMAGKHEDNRLMAEEFLKIKENLKAATAQITTLK